MCPGKVQVETKPTKTVLAARVVFSVYSLLAVILCGVLSPAFGQTVFDLIAVTVLVVYIVSCFALQNILCRALPRGGDLVAWILGPPLLFFFLTGQAPWNARIFWEFVGLAYILVFPVGFACGILVSAPWVAFRGKGAAADGAVRFGLSWIRARRLAAYGLFLAVAVLAAGFWGAARLAVFLPEGASRWRLFPVAAVLGVGMLAVAAITLKNTTVWKFARRTED